MLRNTDFPKFENDMLLRKGVNLANVVGDDDESGGKVERFIDRVLLIMETEVKKSNLKFQYQRVNTVQQEAFYEACLEQALYLIGTGDMNLISGYDPINNTVVSIDEIRKRAISPLAKSILKSEGLLYNGLRSMYDGGSYPGHGNRGGWL